MVSVTLFRQRLVWMPTIIGWLLLLLTCVAASVLLANKLYIFLAPNEPVGARVLVVEGWLTPEELDQAVKTFKVGGYERIVTTGGPISGWPGLYPNTDFARRSADYLTKHGIQRDMVTIVSTPESAQERTFLSAVMLRKSAKRQGITLDSIDIFSSGPHARRSRLLFKMALGQKVRVGILAARPSGFNPDAWWRTSSGVEVMVFQSLGFFWVKCCFWPAPPGSHKELWAES